MKTIMTKINSFKNILIFTVAITLSGCSFMDTIMKDKPELGGDDNEKEVMVCKVPIEVEEPKNLKWYNTRFYVLNKKKMKKIVNGEAEDMPDVYIALSAKGYENLSVNVNNMLNVIKEQKGIIDRLQEYYTKDELVDNNSDNKKEDKSEK